jgi:hypothetical protein
LRVGTLPDHNFSYPEIFHQDQVYTMAPDLPYELHALICSHFDAPTLQTYSLICHQFHSFAQQIIFSKIKLVFPRLILRENNRTESLLRLTESSPQICDSVRSVSLTHKIVQPFKHRMSYLWDDPIVVSLLLRLKNVKKFSMEGRALNFLYWASILPPVQEALTGVCHSNVLTNLALFHIINLPLDVLDGCVALQELSLDLITFESKEMMLFLTDAWKPATPRERRTRLKSLHLAVLHLHFLFFSMWITSSVCSLDISNLQRFSLSLIEEYTDPKTLKVILQPCAKTLEIFCFNPAFGCTYINIAVPFSANFSPQRIKRNSQPCRHQQIDLTSHSAPSINIEIEDPYAS